MRFFQQDPAERRQLLKDNFAKTKDLSDFVGFIIRMTFVLFLIRYFWHMYVEAKGSYFIVRSMWFYCVSLTTVFFICFWFRFVGVVADFFLLDLLKASGNRVIRIINTFFALLFTFALALGLWELVRALGAKTQF